LRTLPGALIGASILGCGLATEPADRLVLSMALSTTDVQADSGVIVHLAAINRGLYPLELETTGGCVLGFRLEGPDGSPVPSWWACEDVLRTVSVAARDSVVLNLLLLPRPRIESGLVRRWLPGTYRIVGQLLGRHTDVLDETPPMGFHLTCHDPAEPMC
jgi:hypothetical protein